MSAIVLICLLTVTGCNVNRVTPKPLRTATPNYQLTPQVTITPVVIIVTATSTITPTPSPTQTATTTATPAPSVTGTRRADWHKTLEAIATPTRIYAPSATPTAER